MERSNGILPVRIALFGAPLVTSADGVRTYPLPRKTLDVLSYLILNRRRSLPRTLVAFTLFPDDDDELARGSLRRNLSYLLSALPEPPQAVPFVLADGKTLAWNAQASATVDVYEFERAIAEHRDEDAIALYAGELLPSLYADWTMAERERLRGEFHQALLRSVHAERSRRHFDEASAFARCLLTEDPWREDVVRLLMAIRHESGDRSGALAEYERFAARLRAEMRTEPMPETVAVREAVVRGALLATSERPGAASRSAAAASELGLPFVGRDTPMETALARWHLAADGHAGVLFVAGEAGIGKSRFVTELARTIEQEGGSVVRGQTSATAERHPYEAFIDALQAAADLGSAQQLLADHATATLTDDRSARVRLFENVRRRVTDLARARPLALIIEDMHWAGADTIAMLEFVTLRLSAAHVLIVVTMRTDELLRGHALRSLSRQLESRESADVLTLTRLDEIESASAIRGALRRDLEPGLVTQAVAWADGVPMLLLEAVRDITAGRSVTGGNIDALVGDRFGRLTPTAAAVLIYSATVGAVFELSLVSAAMGWSDAAVVDALGCAIELGLLRAVGSTRGLSFAFSHHVLHAASYERIPPPDRIRAHAMVARVLAALPESESSRAGETARHFEASGEVGPAARYWCAAASYALSIFANHDARAAATSGLACGGGAASVRYELLRTREDALRRIGGLAERRSDSLALLECSGDDPDRRCEALERVFEAHRDEAPARRKALAQLARMAPLSERYAALYERASSQDAYLDGKLAAARDCAMRAAERFDRLGDQRSALLARLRHIAMLGQLNDFRAAEVATSELRPLIEDSGDAPLAAEFYRVASSAAGDERRDEALTDARRSLELALRVGDRYAEARARQNITSLLGKLRDYVDRGHQMKVTVTAFRDVGDADGINSALLNVAAWEAWHGNFAAAGRTANDLRSDALTSHHLRARLVRGYIALREGRLQEAVAELARARDDAALLGLPLRQVRAEAWLAEARWLDGNAAEALNLLAAALSKLSRLEQPGLCAELLALSARVRSADGQATSARSEALACLELMQQYQVQDRSQAAWHLAISYARSGAEEPAGQLAAESARAFIEDALQLDSDEAEFYAALPWHREAIAFLSGRGLPER